MSFHVEYSANTVGQDYGVGDLHGCYDLLMQTLGHMHFDRTADRLFSVGDLIDRGPKNIEMLELIDEPWFIPVLGNHEMMMISVLLNKSSPTMWLANGGLWVLDYLGSQRYEHLLACLMKLGDLPFAITVNVDGKRIGICHAESPVDDWANIEQVQDDPGALQQMIWGRTKVKQLMPPVTSNIDLTVHGHTQVGTAMTTGNACFIDTGAYRTNKLTVVALDELIQTSELR